MTGLFLRAPCLLLVACASAATTVPARQDAAAAGPARGVRVHYDELLVPHVFADTDAGVFRGLGFTQARDFPVATLANLWSATGRFAEVAGPMVLARDERMRQWGIDRSAHEMASDPAKLDPLTKTRLEAYVAGVNEGRRLWLDTPGMLDRLVGKERELGFDPVPSWLHPLRTKDDPRARLARLFEAEVGLEHVLAFGLAVTAGPEFGGGGSSTRTNVWMMRGGAKDPHTRMVADVHQPLQEFGYRPYFVQLAGPGYDMVGMSAPGFPCVLLGASRTVAFASMTLPAKPRELKEAGLPFRLEERVPLIRSEWSGRLEHDAPARLVRGGETLELIERSFTLRAFDLEKKALVDDPRGARTLRWLRDESLGLEFPVLEPEPSAALDLATQPTVRFEARSFLGQRSPWEAWTRLGSSAHAVAARHAIGPDGIAMGRGQACLFGDDAGRFVHAWSARAARLSERGRERMGELLDGNDPEQRWLGFAGDDGTLLGQGLEGPYAGWILCNSSPGFLAPAEGLEGSLPAGIFDGQPWKSLRQDRARELFERVNADAIHALPELERMALDVQDQWSRRNWPWIAALAGDAEHPLSERARAFVAWIERFRFEGPDGKPGAEEFLAHPLSQVMPFLVLVRDRYEDALIEARASAEALSLAFDPCFPEPSRERFLTETFAANRRALREAIEWAAELHAKTLAGEPGGLVNRRYFTELGERWKRGGALFPEAFAPCALPQASAWGSAVPPVALRWGEVNVYALTPHRSAADPVLGNTRQVDGWLASLFAPSTVELDLPFFRAQTAIAFPIGGTHDSLFQTHHQSFGSYAKSLVPRGADWLALAPVDFGSQVLLLVELREGERPFVRVLPALAATEITAAVPELGLGVLEPYRVTARFACGEWSTLETDEERVRASAVRSLTLDD